MSLLSPLILPFSGSPKPTVSPHGHSLEIEEAGKHCIGIYSLHSVCSHHYASCFSFHYAQTQRYGQLILWLEHTLSRSKQRGTEDSPVRFQEFSINSLHVILYVVLTGLMARVAAIIGGYSFFNQGY